MTALNTLVYGFFEVEQALAMLEMEGLIFLKSRFVHEREPGSDVTVVNDLIFDQQPYDVYQYDIPLSIFERFQKKHYMQFMANIGRGDSYTGKHTGYASGMYLFRRITCFLYDLLLRNNIQLCLFSGLPHEAVDVLIFWLAKEIGIESRMLVMGFYGERKFFGLKNPADYGLYKNKKKVSKPNLENCCYVIDSKHGVKNNAWAVLSDDLLNVRLSMVMEWDTTRPLNINYQEEYYLDRLSLAFQDPDQIESFIYFPLHFQPELATIGAAHPLFDDQVLCIESLAQQIPDNVVILLKEQPSQFFYYRNETFYKRLKAIPQVRFVSPTTDSHSLVRRSKCVATVSGSAGWEALMFGKPVVYFGLPPYREMPGAFAFSEDLDMEAVFEYTVVRKALEAAQRDLLSTMYDGILYFDNYLLHGFVPDKEENIRTCSASIGSIIRDITEENPGYLERLSQTMATLQNTSKKKAKRFPDTLVSVSGRKTRKSLYPFSVRVIIRVLKKIESSSSRFRLFLLMRCQRWLGERNK